jgi:hypothetical protein
MPWSVIVVVALSVIGASKPSVVMAFDHEPFGSRAISASTAARLLAQMCSLSSSRSSRSNSAIISTSRRQPTSLQAISE